MGKFFKRLVSEKLIDDWALTLDWLFDDLKFSKDRNWNGGYTSSYTKKVRSLKYLSEKENRVVYGKCKTTHFPNQNQKQHGETNISKVGSELYIEIIDYSDKSKSPNKQTAYLFIPLSYITQFCKIYEDINKSIMNTTKKDRNAKEKSQKPEKRSH